MDVSFRLLGGKGGFGSLLKSMATKVKVTDYGPSKNLNGRRIRNERNEKVILHLYLHIKFHNHLKYQNKIFEIS